MSATDDPIIGGDTPFVPFSEAYRAFGPDHKVLRMEVEGQEATRAMQQAICAIQWRIEEQEPSRPKDMPHREFMRQFVAGANHDLRALGIEPLLSIQEIEHLSNHETIIAACEAGKKPR